MKRKLVILKVKLHLTSLVLGFLPLRRGHWGERGKLAGLAAAGDEGGRGGHSSGGKRGMCIHLQGQTPGRCCHLWDSVLRVWERIRGDQVGQRPLSSP